MQFLTLTLIKEVVRLCKVKIKRTAFYQMTVMLGLLYKANEVTRL